jgi:ADP-heptose:LPS heptosyltransferase
MLVEFKVDNSLTLNMNKSKTTLLKDNTYICDEEWLSYIDLPYTKTDDKFINNIDNNDLNNKKILIIRSAGFGDVLFTSSIIKVIKSRFDNVTIGFSIINNYHNLLNIVDGVDTIHSMPINKKEFDEYDYCLTFTGVLERGSFASLNENVYDLYLQHVGINPDNVSNDVKRPFIKENLLDNVTPKDNLIGIHPFSGNPIRSYNIYLANELIKKLLKNNYNVVIFGSQEDKEKNIGNISQKVNWSCDSVKDFLSIARLLKSTKCVISVDSVITHLAQATNTKTYALYGPFSGHSRLKYYKNITIIDSNPDCRCFEHQKLKCKKNYTTSPCLNIDPQLIVNLIDNNSYTLSPVINEPKLSQYGV